ncbi:MAG: peptidoglycan-binding protein [Candidatus Pacebacteria bacterium]|nr:peptidoglycan-binding protein [Candidatus Paceibacterota bacterium]
MTKYKIAGLVAAVAGFSLAFTAVASSYNFATNLKMGMTSADVKNLQVVLNSSADTQVAATGVGSAGLETSYFGALTKAAVVKFQAKNGLPTTGYVGPMTRGVLNTMGTVTTGLVPGCTSTTGFSPTTGASCAGGVVATLPAGCTSTVGFSPTTGQSCSAVVPPVVTPAGPVVASVATTNPASGLLVDGQATANLAEFTFAGTGTVSSVTLQRSGISDQNALSNVYLYDGVTRLTDGYSFNQSGTMVMNGLSIAVSGSKTISVKADVAASASSSNATLGVSLTNYTVGGVATAASLAGNEHSFAVGNLATVVVGTQTVTTATVNAGTSSYTFWSAPVQVSTRSALLKSAAFRMVGSAPSDALSSVKLFIDGVDTGVAGTVASVQGSNYLMFDLTVAPKTLTTGSHTVAVRATIDKGSNRSVQVSLQQAADLMVTDSQVGVNIAATGLSNSGGVINIAAGSATLLLDPAFQATTNVSGGASNVAIGKFKVHAYGEDVKVSSLTVLPVLGTMTPTGTTLDEVTVFFNGSQIGSSQDFSGTALTFQLGSQMIAAAGVDSTLEIRANISSSASVNYTAGTVAVTVSTGVGNAQGQLSLTSVNFPTSDVVGNTLTVSTATLAISKNTGYADQTASPNTASVKIGSFVLQNQSTTESVRVTSLLVALSGTSALTNFSALRTSETSGSGATPVQPQASNTFSVDFTLAPGATKTIDILADTSTATSVSVTNTNTVAQTMVVSNTATPAANGVKASRAVTVTGTTGWDAGDTATVNVNGLPSVYTCVGANESATTVAAGLVSAINLNNNVNGIITASNLAGVITIEADTAGTAGNSITLTVSKVVASGDGNIAAAGATLTGGTANTAQISTLTPANVEIGDVFTAGIGSTNVSVTATAATVANVTGLMTTAWNANSTLAAIATAADGTTAVNLTAVVSGTAGAFTATSSTTNGSVTAAATIITTTTVTSIGSTSNVSTTSGAIPGQTITLASGTVTNPPTIVTSASTVAQLVAAAAGGAADATKAEYNFISTSGPSTVTGLTFTVTGTGTVTTVKVVSPSGTVYGSAPIASGVAYMTGLNIPVPLGGSGANVDALVSYSEVGATGVTSYTTSKISLTSVTYTSGGTTATFTPTVDAPTMTVVGSKPSFTVTDSSDTLSNSQVKIAEVTVTADAKGDIKLGKLPITVTSTGVATVVTGANNIVVKDTNDTVVTTTNTGLAVSAGASGSDTIIFGASSATAYLITAGTSKTFRIYATPDTVSGAIGTTSLSTKLGSSGSVEWYDAAGNSTTARSASAVFNYPTTTSVITN